MQITGVNRNFDVTVNLVGSKSESNRALMIGYYGGFTPRVTHLSSSDDTRLLIGILDSISYPSNPEEINCQNAGTVMRFLATALSFRTGEWILTGSDRMLQRPVGDLVDALRKMDADIEYMGREGFPPLKIHGRVQTHGRASRQQRPIHIDITRSSQFASSILLALPIVERHGRAPLHLDGDLSSLPYINLTIDVMRKFGVDVHRDGRDIFVQHSEYQDIEYTVESDWTCASYWYEIVAFSENGRVRLRNLHLDSKQGDAIIAKWFEQFGVQSVQDGNDIIIGKNHSIFPNDLSFDFINNPDLYPTIAATCAGLSVEAHFTGLRNLKHKESDRVAAMTTELARVKTHGRASLPIVFDSHNDHRIAMALAPLAMKIGAIEINNADVVSKSYPNFWEEISPLATLGRNDG